MPLGLAGWGMSGMLYTHRGGRVALRAFLAPQRGSRMHVTAYIHPTDTTRGYEA